MSARKIFPVITLLILGLFVLNACGDSEAELAALATLDAIYAEETRQAAEAAKPPEPEPEPVLMAGEPGTIDRTLEDTGSSIFSGEHRAPSGDRFIDGYFERPFTSEEMIYQPDLDIQTVDFSPGDEFLYFTIRLYGLNSDPWGLNGVYGIEFDRKLKGRGDLLVLAEKPQEEWSMTGVSVFTDQNGDVGGPKPIVADRDFNGSGYDVQVEMGNDMVAYARIDPDDEAAVQFAISRALLENAGEFLWGASADNGLRDAAQFDYNDTMGPSEAGSPIKGHEDYPLKALFNLDNTCRLPYGFAQESGSIPGMCINVPPKRPGCVCVLKRPNQDKVFVCVEWECP